MTRKLGQIIAVRENTWMIRIPMGCDPQTKLRNDYNRTVHGSLRQAQKFLGKKINELGAYIDRDGARYGWINSSISGSRRSKCRFAARPMKATRVCSQNTSAHRSGRSRLWVSGRSTSKVFIKRCQIAGSRHPCSFMSLKVLPQALGQSVPPIFQRKTCQATPICD